VFASGDSNVPCELVPVVSDSLWDKGVRGDTTAYLQLSVTLAWEQAERFDLFHSHVEHLGFHMARHCSTPVVTTLHKRLDVGGVAELIDAMPDVPLIAISDSQRRWNPAANWIATIHHGLDFSQTPISTEPGDYLAVVGRISPDKGIVEAIGVARRTGLRLVVAAKCAEPDEVELFESAVRPAIRDGIVEWRGEIDTKERDELLAGALATMMLGAWPEPFGLVAIESMATGTPVIARRAGAVTETIDHGETGFLVDDVHEAVLAINRVHRLRRDRIAAYARGRFSAERMTSLYEQAFAKVLGQGAAAGEGEPAEPARLSVGSATSRSGVPAPIRRLREEATRPATRRIETGGVATVPTPRAGAR
jgi:glycosyltransferase involved in cell wall biosynthesis